MTAEIITDQERARLAKNEYYRQWRRKNPEKVKQHIQTYWLRRAKEKNL